MREPLVLTDADLERVTEVASDDGLLLALLAELPVPQREALEARVIEELSYPEVAARLKCSELVARQRVSRGLARLRARLEGSS